MDSGGTMICFLTGVFLFALALQPGHAFILRGSSPLHLWRLGVEVSSQTFHLHPGNRFSIACDGKVSSSSAVKRLSWYGPDRNIISDEDRNSRVRVEPARSPQYLRLQFRPVTAAESGIYICSGYFGPRHVEYRYIVLIVEDRPTTPVVTTVPTVRPTTTTTTTTVRSTRPTIIQTTEASENCTGFQCGSGECFAQNFRCDSFPDCNDHSDEKGCSVAACPEGMFACAIGSKCIPPSNVCNTVMDCDDGSDETDTACGIIA